MEDKNAKVLYINRLPLNAFKAAWYGQDAHTSYVLFFFLEVDILALVLRKYLAVGLAW